MAKVCDICGRGSVKDASRSHSNVRNNTRQNINLQSRRVNGGSIKVCTKCLKTLAKNQK